MKVRDVEKLIEEYGDNITLGDIKKSYGRPFRCLNCDGSGKVFETIKVPYPSGLPDSGWVPPTEKLIEKTCAFCEGHGWTKKELVPIMEQTGWKEV